MPREELKMPEPIGWITSESIYRLERGGNDSKGTVPIHKSRSYVAKTPVLLTTQAEAYADARVKEVLEEAQRILTGMYTEAVKARVPEDEDEEGYNQGLLERALALTDATLQIRALIPPTPPTEKP